MLIHTTKRRGVAIAVVGLTLAAMLSACSTGTTGASSPSTDSSKLKTITFVNPLPDDPGWSEVSRCMAEEAKKKGLTYTESGPTGGTIDQNYMGDRVNQAIADKIDAIVTFPLTPATGHPAITPNPWKKEGPVVSRNNLCPARGSQHLYRDVSAKIDSFYSGQ